MGHTKNKMIEMGYFDEEETFEERFWEDLQDFQKFQDNLLKAEVLKQKEIKESQKELGK